MSDPTEDKRTDEPEAPKKEKAKDDAPSVEGGSVTGVQPMTADEIPESGR